MSEYKLPADASELGLRYRDTKAVDVDWAVVREKLHGEDVFVLPKITAAVLEEYGFADGHDLTDPDELEEAVEAFEQSDSFFEWKDRYQPLMNYLWECEPVYNSSFEQAAQLIEEHGGSTSLVRYTIDGDEFTGIALTGGGMNLAHDLAAAYVCCGHAPPTALMDDALSQISEMSEAVRPLVIGAASRLAESLRHTADDLLMRADRARLSLEPKEEAPSGPTA